MNGVVSVVSEVFRLPLFGVDQTEPDGQVGLKAERASKNPAANAINVLQACIYKCVKRPIFVNQI